MRLVKKFKTNGEGNNVFSFTLTTNVITAAACLLRPPFCSSGFSSSHRSLLRDA